jgi:hypothetical protein
MSEYIEIEADPGEDGRSVTIRTNLPLTEPADVERYASLAEMEEGSPVAQALAGVSGIATLRLSGDTLWLTCEPEADTHAVIADVSAALRDFFL